MNANGLDCQSRSDPGRLRRGTTRGTRLPTVLVRGRGAELFEELEFVVGHALLAHAQLGGHGFVRPAANEQEFGAAEFVPLAVAAEVIDLLGDGRRDGLFFEMPPLAAAGDGARGPVLPIGSQRLSVLLSGISGKVGRRPSARANSRSACGQRSRTRTLRVAAARRSLADWSGSR